MSLLLVVVLGILMFGPDSGGHGPSRHTQTTVTEQGVPQP